MRNMILGALAAQLPIPTISTPFDSFDTGTRPQIINDISRGRISALPHVLLRPIAFDLITYLEGMERHVEGDYAELVVFGGKPRLQCVGDKLDADTWQIVLHDEFCSPATEITKPVRPHRAGQPRR